MTCIAAQTYKLKSTNFLDLTLTDDLSAPINDATVEVTVRVSEDDDAETVAGEVWPILAEYVADSDGKYRAILADDLLMVKNEIYFAHVVSSRIANDYTDYATVEIIARQG